MQVNSRQRNLLIVAAAAIVGLWLLEVRSEGLADSHWIVVTSIVVTLLFITLSSKPDVSAPAQQVASKTLIDNRGADDEGTLIVEKRFRTCVAQWQDFMTASLVDRMPKATATDRANMEPFMHQAACKLAFANYLLVILHRGSDAGQGDDAKALRTYATGTLANRLKQSLEHVQKVVSGLPPVGRKECVNMAVQQLVEYELLLDRTRKQFASGGVFPLDSIYAKVNDEAKFGIASPADREAFFGIKYREETGRLLHRTPGMTA